MRLTLDQALHRIGALLENRVAPALDDDFVAQSERLARGLLNICANWADDAAAIRVAENAAIRATLGDCAALAGSDLAGRLADAAASSDPGLRIGQLDAENHRLRALLVEAHARLEAIDSAEARASVQAIWRLLEDIEQARAPREQVGTVSAAQ